VNLGRKVIAVILGYIVFAGSAVLLFKIAGRDPHAPQNFGFKLFAVLYGIVFAALGGLLAARIAPTKRNVPAALVAILIALGATISLIATWGAGSTWSQWAALLLMAPSALFAPMAVYRRTQK
jgi:FtsH-binding integral membrane protein